MKRPLLLLILFLIYAWLSAPAAATEIYARQTGKGCAVCHVDPAGGGELTAAGKEFAASRAVTGEAPHLATSGKVVRFAAGYLHMLTAILWFGTILYVHLVLKPAYAAGGLPRGEVKVGVLSMAVMGVTGAVLTHYRVSSPEMLLQTRFGGLLLAKIFLYLVMVLSATYVVLFIGPKLKARRGEPVPLPAGGELTLEELGAFDGKEGRPAYFACEGRLYDASASKLWREGMHMGRHHAGEELSEALKLAPHGPEKVLLMPEVGRLAAATQAKAPLHERVFFFMAYMNLTIVFLIVLILSLWRWA